jgi:2-aminoethylphosphonate-pyruvate transaminase
VTVDTALILAAGRGIRLGPTGRLLPKGFLQPDPRREPIIVESIERLTSRGVRRIVVVTGHLSRFYDELAATRGGRDGVTIEVVHNSRFATSGSLYSLACARERITGDCLVVESDLVYEGRALDAALDSPRADVVVVSGPTRSGDEVYVSTRGERIVSISKDPATAMTSFGELVGICRISHPLFERMVQQADLDPSAEYETGGLSRLAADYPVYCARIADLVWAEIDTPAHFERVQTQVYPRLLEQNSDVRHQMSADF